MATALAYALLCLIWGSTWLAIRIGLVDIPPFWSLSIRLLFALAFVIVVAKMRRTPLEPLRRNLPPMLAVSLLTYPVAYGLVYWGEQYVTSGLTAVLFSAMPFFVALFSWWLLPAERVSLRSGLGLVLGVTGLAVVYWDQIVVGSPERLWGMVAITASSAVAAFTTTTIRRSLAHVPPVALTIVTVLGGLLIVPFFALATESTRDIHLSTRAMAAIIYLGICGSGVTFVIYYRLLGQLTALQMSLITFITPMIALALGAVFDYEPFTLRAGLGMSLVLGGVLLAAVRSRVMRPRGAVVPSG